MEWWDALKYIIDTVQPIYKFLRFADQDKKPNICEVVTAYQTMKQELRSFFGTNVSTLKEYIQVVDDSCCPKSEALQEFDVFRQKVGKYGSEMAIRMAMDPKTSPWKRKLQKGPTKGYPKRPKGKGTAKLVCSDTETDDGEGIHCIYKCTHISDYEY
ncbi:uncharacterized protein LOC120655522 [Panicum virgatum]|uniref:uncharacterized protein LOC120655522 n=1 Tax=Panicum virgatum TaxID=38727 RepID=UPI0019D59859|nr:uncharacterized protein LOC120655522 [Panicum virgatum]